MRFTCECGNEREPWVAGCERCRAMDEEPKGKGGRLIRRAMVALEDGEHLTTKELADRCGVERRTILRRARDILATGRFRTWTEELFDNPVPTRLWRRRW